MLVKSQQAMVAKYLYEPFGTLIAAEGPLRSSGIGGKPQKSKNVNPNFYFCDPDDSQLFVFGKVIAADGPLADGNLYRFSSKEHHPTSGLVYYGYRFYDPNISRCF